MRYHLGDLGWETTGSAASSSSSISVPDGTQWGVGDYGEFVNNGEGFRVSAVVTNDLTATRGYYSTTAATQASGRILKEPRFKFNEITNAVSTVVQGFLPHPRVYKVVADTITPAPSTTTWYDLASDALGIVSAYQTQSGTVMQFGQHHRWDRIIFRRNLPTTLVASGVGVAFPDGFLDPTDTVYVNYAARITDTQTVAGTYDDFSDGDAITEAIILGTVAFLQGALELRKPRNSLNESNRLQGESYYNQLFHSAIATAEKQLRSTAPLMGTA